MFVPVPALAYVDVWYVFYDVINRYGLDKFYIPTILIFVAF